jgi:hypothetical protein
MATLTTERHAIRKASIPSTGDPFGPEFATAWLESLVEAGLVAGPVLVASEEMLAEAVALALRGVDVKLAASGAAADRCRDEAKRAGARLKAVFPGGVFGVKPWQMGSVATIFDRTVFAGLEPDQRFAYVSRMGRILAPEGRLIGVFRLGGDGGDAPRALPRERFEQLFFRYFTLEQFVLAAPAAPGADEAWCGVLRRK